MPVLQGSREQGERRAESERMNGWKPQGDPKAFGAYSLQYIKGPDPEGGHAVGLPDGRRLLILPDGRTSTKSRSMALSSLLGDLSLRSYPHDVTTAYLVGIFAMYGWRWEIEEVSESFEEWLTSFLADPGSAGRMIAAMERAGWVVGRAE